MHSLAVLALAAVRIAGLPPQDWPIGDGGPATAALLTPVALAFEANGNLLIADSYNKRIRRVTPAGIISTAVDCAKYGLRVPVGLALDSNGNLYVYDTARLVRIAPDGRAAEITPAGFPAVDARDNLYLADFDGGAVWKRSPAGVLERAATVPAPLRVGFDAAGNLLVADAQRLMRVNADGTLITLAGGGLTSLEPRGMAAAPDGSIYIASAQSRIWRWQPGGEMSIVAGDGEVGFSDGCAESGGVPLARYARISPADLVFDSAGRLYAADGWNHRVRRIDANGEIHSVAGSGIPPATSPLRSPGALAADADGNVYLADRGANRVLQITSAGQLETIAGRDSPPPGEDAACYSRSGDVLSAPEGVAVDRLENVYISDTGNRRILRRAPGGAITTVVAGLTRPTVMAADAQGTVYFIDNGRAWRLRTDGVIEAVDVPWAGAVATTPEGTPVWNGSAGLFVGTLPLRGALAGEEGPVAVDSSGAIYTTLGSGGLHRITRDCNSTVLQGDWGFAAGAAADGRGNLYVSDANSVFRVGPLPAPGPQASPFLAHPGVRNAASNYVASEYVPSRNPLHPPTRVEVNDVIAPDEIVRITGGCLGPLEPAQSGPRVLFNGEAATLLRAQSAEILAVVPRSVSGAVTLDIEYNGGRTTDQLKAEAAAPGVFGALNQDLTLNGPDRPAAPGSAVALFLTGTGGLPVTVEIGGIAAEVLYSGAAPGFAGMAQVNVRVPASLASGAASVRVAAAGYTRPQPVVLWISEL